MAEGILERVVQWYRPASLRRHPIHRPRHRCHFACSRRRAAFTDKICIGRTRAETACGLQRVLKTNGDMPPIKHDRNRRQGLAL